LLKTPDQRVAAVGGVGDVERIARAGDGLFVAAQRLDLTYSDLKGGLSQCQSQRIGPSQNARSVRHPANSRCRRGPSLVSVDSSSRFQTGNLGSLNSTGLATNSTGLATGGGEASGGLAPGDDALAETRTHRSTCQPMVRGNRRANASIESNVLALSMIQGQSHQACSRTLWR